MGFYTINEKMFNQAFTENGDQAFKSTGSACLDYFSLAGAMRFNLKHALTLFMKSYFENPLLTIKILFYIRDIRGGLGERCIFRSTFNALANMYPEVALQLLKYIPEYGRYDDLLVCLTTPLKEEVIEFIRKQLAEDLENKKNNRPISLLAKWLPSINTSSDESRKFAIILSKGLQMSKEEYRKMLSTLRKGIIIENNLREKDYTFEYNTIPGCAMFKYKESFIRNDKIRYENYLDEVNNGKTKMNTKNLYPYEIIRDLGKHQSKSALKSLDTMWKNFDRNEISSKTIVVRDGSGSMCDFHLVSAIDVATSLAILFAEQLTGEFKNKFITFSSKPKIVEIKGETIYEKYNFINSFCDYTNTNIEKVYTLILNTYKHKEFKKEDALDRIVIISDMEFDCLEDNSKSTFEYFKDEFSKLGFEIPELVFWNVRARNIHFPALNEYNVKLVGGSSPKIIDEIIKNKGMTAYDYMIECLNKYSCFDTIEF